MHNLQLKRSRRHPRALHGHPWAFAGEVTEALPDAANGTGVRLLDTAGRLLGCGIYNNRSQLVWRRYSRREQEWSPAVVQALLDTALSRRPAEEPFQRLVWSEADDLPGLVVDRLGDMLVLQSLTLGMDTLQPVVSDFLQSRFPDCEVVLRNDAPIRKREGLELYVRTLSGHPCEPRLAEIDGVRYRLTLDAGQKTGFYLDQRHEHAALAPLAQGQRVLDVCTHEGGFALHCARAGAASVTALDISATAISAAMENAARNGVNIRFLTENAFDYFSRPSADTYDWIILDPPPFARNRAAVEGALRGYKELNLRALQRLPVGGHLATYTCSQHVDRATFREVLRSAAHDSGRTVTILSERRQPPDHPVRLDFPESEYLHGFWLRVDA
ncbi:MAG: class I SAM-dependent rRNA methyltransferase [Opitutales bacterium]|nr:class I SAM-dependent rRNA methyltransferase [Opitutales bacterium]